MPVANLNRCYQAWINMRQRCNNPRNKDYRNYGKRGISICIRWNQYALFALDMGDPPAGMTLERRDVNGNYAPDNCAWATPAEQMQNQRRTKLTQIDIDSIRRNELYLNSAALARTYGVHPAHILQIQKREKWL